MSKRTIVVTRSPRGVAEHAAVTLRRVCTEAPGARVRVALPGGSTPSVLYELLREKYGKAIPWERLEVFFGDERAVPRDHPDSNYGLAERLLLSTVAVPREQIHRMPADAENLVEAARRYEEEIRRTVASGTTGVPVFDLVWLGLGRDGHTASLFPGSPALNETERLVAATEAPRPDTRRASAPVGDGRRMTFTLPLINAARHVQFVITGGDKADVAAAVLEKEASRAGNAVYPAARVFPDGELEWILDSAAAGELERDLIA